MTQGNISIKISGEGIQTAVRVPAGTTLRQVLQVAEVAANSVWTYMQATGALNLDDVVAEGTVAIARSEDNGH